ncbi:4-hydroxyphenylpyruvate dioxygenase [Paludibacterium yongneupense]|uniref:4-hydroxyphenylpyruvate dioxygenase n=1 Tax=Paludibacterium yongneupense TaxID=400061 RepID=UPI0005621651|nr:4-hydroxyphenylpyruvate dioxygenase [Paludibacterium yongneupense]
MMKPHPSNPLMTDGFEFVEFTAPDAAGLEALGTLFCALGFRAEARHRNKNIVLWRQGDIRFLLNGETEGPVAAFAARHGPSVSGMAWRVSDARRAFLYAVEHGAVPHVRPRGVSELEIPAIEGVGGSALFFVDRFGGNSLFDIDYIEWPDVLPGNDCGLLAIDHLTHNVHRGEMAHWAAFYQRIGNFQPVRYFDIEGKLTGLVSQAMTSPCGKIRIPINESSDDSSQIEEFLRDYHGEGIQHIALSCRDIHASVEALRAAGVAFMETPDSYYARADERVPGHGEDLARLMRNRILVDGAPANGEGLLLQIFTCPVIGPVFFEIIQRRGNEGFGEGNFRALFEAIEDDQIRRGVLGPG